MAGTFIRAWSVVAKDGSGVACLGNRLLICASREAARNAKREFEAKTDTPARLLRLVIAKEVGQ